MKETSFIRADSGRFEIVRLSFGREQANTYFLVSDGHAVVVDACSKNVSEALAERGLTPDYVILTHEHADHIWGLNALRGRFPEARVIAQEQCSRAIGDPKANKAAQYWIYAVLRFGEDYENEEARNRRYRCRPAEIVFDDSYAFAWRGCPVRLVHTPGHSPGSCMAFIGDRLVFSGDTMLRDAVFFGFEGGDAKAYASVAQPLIDAIPDQAEVFPGHGKPFIKGEWKKKYERIAER